MLHTKLHKGGRISASSAVTHAETLNPFFVFAMGYNRRRVTLCNQSAAECDVGPMIIVQDSNENCDQMRTY